MKPVLFLFCFVFFCLTVNHAVGQSSIVVQQSDGSVRFTPVLDSAIKYAQTGASLYLPGGIVHSTSATLTIQKRINIYGCGINRDSSKATGKTQLGCSIWFGAGAENSLITGVDLGAKVLTLNASRVKALRCNMKILQIGGNAESQYVSECLAEYVDLNCTTAFLVEKSVFGYMEGVATTTACRPHGELKNCLFYNTAKPWLNGSTTGILRIRNNIVLQTNVDNNFGNGSVFENNLFVASALRVDGDTANNLFNEPIAAIFQGYTPPTKASPFLHDLRLKTGSRGRNAGTDGTDVGIYGTSAPFKQNGQAFNPQFVEVTVPQGTNATGQLPIRIKVKAQAR